MFKRAFLSATAVAVLLAASAVSPALAQGNASRFVGDLGQNAIGTLRSTTGTLAEREAQFRQILRQGFDLAFIGRFAMGRYWRTATPEQRSDYQRLFAEYVLKTYSNRLGGYAGETFRVISEKPAGKKDIMVLTEISRPSGPPIKASWRVRKPPPGYRIIDVQVEGISMVVTQRQEFAAVIQRHGVPGLIEVLRARTDKVAATAAR